MTYDYQIIQLEGMTVNEAVTENEDGSYSIFVNSHLCQDKQRQAVDHAFQHIEMSDFNKEDVQSIEAEAHRKGEKMSENRV